MERGYKTSLVRCFQLHRLSYEDLVGFCSWLVCEPPALKNWNMEWARCTRAAEVLRKPDGTPDMALKAATFGTEGPLARDRAARVLDAAETLLGKKPLAGQYDVAKWAPQMKAWRGL